MQPTFHIKKQSKEGIYMAIIGILLGIILILVGYFLAKKNSSNRWYLLSAAGGICLMLGIVYGILVLLLVSGVDYEEENNINYDQSSQVTENQVKETSEIIENTNELTDVKAESRKYELLGYKRLSEKEQSLYNEMKPKIMNMEYFCYDLENYSYEELDEVLIAWEGLVEDYPSISCYFMINEVDNDEGYIIALESYYYASWETEEITDVQVIQEKMEILELTCDDIIEKMPSNISTYEQYLYLAKAVSTRADYDYDFTYPSHYTPCGMIDGLLICEGYSKAYKLLCQKADLWCDYVGGAYNGWSHQWNLIEINGRTYHVDVTWCDEQGLPGSDEWLRYFALSQEQILIDHIINDETVADGEPLVDIVE
jgi:hypothetical protein